MKNQKGITLIALVVTIIVLLILAGVTIALLTGDNGILTNSNEAKKQTQRQQAIEDINIALNSIKTEVLSQINKDSAYDPNDYANSSAEPTASTPGGLQRDNLTGITTTKSAAVTTTTGYYITYNSTNKKITITYINAENHFRVDGTIDFTTFSNGGKIEGATASNIS